MRQSSKLPSICTMRAPRMCAWASFPDAIRPWGISTAQSKPACAAYAAAEAAVLPVEAHSSSRSPRDLAAVTAVVIPRSLNDPVGLAPSTLRYTVHPVISDRYRACSSGVEPSPRLTTSPASAWETRSPNRAITPHGRTGCGGEPGGDTAAADSR